MQHPAHFLAFPRDLCSSFSLQRACVALPLVALHLFQPSSKLWMQQFRAAGSDLAKRSSDSSLRKTTSIYDDYWRHLIMLGKLRLHTSNLQLSQSCQSLCSEVLLLIPAQPVRLLLSACHEPYILCIQAPTQGPAPPWSCKVQPQCSGMRLLSFVTEPALKKGHLSAEHLGSSLLLWERAGHRCRNRGCSGSQGEDRPQR